MSTTARTSQEWVAAAERGELTATEREALAHVLHAFRLPGGIPPGGFIGALLEAALRADLGNLARLSRGFPEYVGFVQACKHVDDGAQRLVATQTGGRR